MATVWLLIKQTGLMFSLGKMKPILLLKYNFWQSTLKSASASLEHAFSLLEVKPVTL